MCSSMGMWTETESSIQQEWKKKKKCTLFSWEILYIQFPTAEDRNPDKYKSTAGTYNMHAILHASFMSLQRDWFLFIHDWGLEATIINSRHSEYVSWYTTSHRLSLYVLILIWSSHHSGLLSEEKKKRARCNKPCPQKQTPLWEPGSAEMKSC